MARLKMNEQWNYNIEYFEHVYPELAEQVVDWYPYKQMHLMVKLNDGSRYVYNITNHNLYKFYDPVDPIIEDEESCRQDFARKLRNKMNTILITQEMLANESGISRITISKYLNGRATPSIYNLRRICDVLGCTANELMYTE